MALPPSASIFPKSGKSSPVLLSGVPLTLAFLPFLLFWGCSNSRSGPLREVLLLEGRRGELEGLCELSISEFLTQDLLVL